MLDVFNQGGARLGDTAGGHSRWLMAQRGAASLKVSKRPNDGLGFGKQRGRDLREHQAVAVLMWSEQCWSDI